MASAAGVAGVRATLDLGSKSSKCVQCGEPDSARITGKPEIGRIREGFRFARIYSTVHEQPDNARASSTTASTFGGRPPGMWVAFVRNVRWFPDICLEFAIQAIFAGN